MSDPDEKDATQTVERATKYVDQLSAHLAAGGAYGLNNLRDCVDMVREFADRIEALEAENARLREALEMVVDDADRLRDTLDTGRPR